MVHGVTIFRLPQAQVSVYGGPVAAVVEVGVEQIDPGRVFHAIAKAFIDTVDSLTAAGQPIGRGDAFTAAMDMTAVFAIGAGITADEFADEAARAWGRAVALGERQ